MNEVKNIKIDWVEEKTSAKGMKYKTASIIYQSDTEEIRLENVAVFSSFAQYNDVAPGREVKGIIREKDYQGKISYSLDNVPGAPKPTNTARTAAIERAMDKKAANIEEAQLNKEWSIMISSTARDATLIVTSLITSGFYKGTTPEKIRELWQMWRKWLIDNWEVEKTQNGGSGGDELPF